MPELPEVETVLRGIEPHLIGNQIKEVQINRPDLRIPFPPDLKEILSGQRVTRLERRAKYILIHLKNGKALVVHLGMSGKLSVQPRGHNAPQEKHDHLVLMLQDGKNIVYNDPRRFGMIFLVESDNQAGHPAFALLGPEPFGKEFTPVYLKEKFSAKKTSIKQALLDQRIVAGLGNIYVCEALYYAGIDPRKEAGKISLPKLALLVSAVQAVLKKAIKAGGSTLKDYRTADGALGYFQHSFAVYDKAHLPCGQCDCKIDKTGGVKRIVQSGRSTFYCPVKQKK
jgi:formamidopyrimidine-DNA glycosylase